jgi:hypothetical protein
MENMEIVQLVKIENFPKKIIREYLNGLMMTDVK